MDTYIIICNLGTRKGTIKAESSRKAMDKYIGNEDCSKYSCLRSVLIAIPKEDFETFQKQVNKIKIR